VTDFLGRDRWEQRFYTAVQGVQRDTLARVMGTIREVGGWSGGSPDLWREYDADLRAALFPLLEGVYMDAAKQTLGESTIGVEWMLVNQRAADWARGYGFDLVRKIGDTTRDRLQRTISRYFEEQRTMGVLRADIEKFIPDLRTRLGRFIFARERASMIASTEVTRASAEGQAGLVAEIKTENPDVRMIGLWFTNADELVCPICRPLNGQQKTAMGYAVGGRTIQRPPAHVRCRCWENYQFIMPRRKRG